MKQGFTKKKMEEGVKMDLSEAIRQRHSVRKYRDQPIEEALKKELQKEIQASNEKSGLSSQIYFEEADAFDSFLARYGAFKNAKNYIALVGKKSDVEKCGYYGEHLVLKAMQMGLATCWIGGTYNKKKCKVKIKEDEKLFAIIAIGYGESAGSARKSKKIEAVSRTDGEMPDWFKKGVEAALLAPTAINQQKFMLSLKGNDVTAKAGVGFYTKLDLGIVKCHFEIGAGLENFGWKES